MNSHDIRGMVVVALIMDELIKPEPIQITVREATDKWCNKDVTVKETSEHGVITVDGILYHITDLPPPKPIKTKFNSVVTRNQRKRASRKLRGK